MIHDLYQCGLLTGQQYDASTKLYSMRARYYDPAAGRFLSRDTWAYNYQNPRELNRYAYVAGNPVNWRDPSGYTVGETITNWGKNISQFVRSFVRFRSDVIAGAISGAVGYLAGVLIVSVMDHIFTGSDIRDVWSKYYFSGFDLIGNTLLGSFLGVTNGLILERSVARIKALKELYPGGWLDRFRKGWGIFKEQIRKFATYFVMAGGLAGEVNVITAFYNNPGVIAEKLSDVIIGFGGALFAGLANGFVSLADNWKFFPDLGFGPFRIKGGVIAANTMVTLVQQTADSLF